MLVNSINLINPLILWLSSSKLIIRAFALTLILTHPLMKPPIPQIR